MSSQAHDLEQREPRRQAAAAAAPEAGDGEEPEEAVLEDHWGGREGGVREPQFSLLGRLIGCSVAYFLTCWVSGFRL